MRKPNYQNQFTVKMNYKNAISALQKGEKVRRTYWGIYGAFLWLKPAATIRAEWSKDPILKAITEKNGGTVKAADAICMLTADKIVITGWVASSVDMAAEDWEVIE